MRLMLERHLGRSHFLIYVALVGCQVGGSGEDSGSGRMDTGPLAVDSGPPASCSIDADCDDTFGCTIDSCVVGGVCEHTALDSRCTGDERCVEGRGCVVGTPSDCTDGMDCQNASACDGVEVCIRGMCIPGDPVDCNDNNMCTTDTCVDPAGSCTYSLASGCDGGIAMGDAGPGCDPFDPTMDYAGSWRILPSVACDPGLGGGYSIGNASFSVSGDTLTVTMGSFTLTQTPAPTGSAFSVSGSNGCASVTLVGTMDCDARFTATWMANHSGGCSACGATNMPVAGRR